MRIVHLYHEFEQRGGIEDTLRALSHAQAAAGLEPVALCANRLPITHEAHLDGVRVIRAASFGRYYMPFCPSWPAWISHLAPEVLHLHLPCPLGEWAVWLAKPPRLVVSLHNDYVRPQTAVRLHTPMHRAVLEQADAILVSTQDYAETSPVLDGLLDKVRIVPYGIDLNRYLNFPEIEKRKQVLSAGRLTYYKGIEVLLEAAPDIESPIHIIGEGRWGRKLRANGNSHVQFLGGVSEDALIREMHTSRVFVFPSTGRSEAFGLSQLKAMACGLPVVSTDLPGVRWVNQHGLRVPVNNRMALAEAVNRVLKDHALYDDLSCRAREWASRFDLSRMAQATVEIYTSL